MEKYDPLYISFFYHFNVARDYFECHEVMEELWLEEGRYPFYQGLLQIAVGLYHHRNGNVNGAVKLFTAGMQKLRDYRSPWTGIDLEGLLRDSEIYLDKLERIAEAPFEQYDLSITIVDPALRRQVEEFADRRQ